MNFINAKQILTPGAQGTLKKLDKSIFYAPMAFELALIMKGNFFR